MSVQLTDIVSYWVCKRCLSEKASDESMGEERVYKASVVDQFIRENWENLKHE